MACEQVTYGGVIGANPHILDSIDSYRAFESHIENRLILITESTTEKYRAAIQHKPCNVGLVWVAHSQFRSDYPRRSCSKLAIVHKLLRVQGANWQESLDIRGFQQTRMRSKPSSVTAC